MTPRQEYRAARRVIGWAIRVRIYRTGAKGRYLTALDGMRRLEGGTP